MIKSKFWLFAFLVLLLIAGNFFYTTRRSENEARGRAADRLATAAREARAQEAEAGRAVQAMAEGAAGLPAVIDAVKAATKAGKAPTAEAFDGVRAALADMATQTGEAPQSFLVLTTARGAGVLREGAEAEVGETKPDVPTLAEAEMGESGAALWDGGDGALLRVASAPVLVDGKPAGALVLGYAVDPARAKSVASAAGADVTYLLDGKPVASSAGDAGSLAAAAKGAAEDAVFGVGEAQDPYVLAASKVVGFAPVAGYARKIPLEGPAGAAVVVSTGIRQANAALAQYLEYQMMAVALFLFVALVWSFFVAQGGYGTPKQMEKVLQRAAEGDLEARLDAKKYPQPFRRLAETINRALDQAERRINPGMADQVLAPKDADLSQVLGGAPEAAEASEADAAAFPFGDEAPAEVPAAAAEPQGFEGFEAPPAGAAEAEAASPAPASSGFDPFAEEPEPQPQPQAQPAAEPAWEPAPAAEPEPEPDSEGNFFSDSTRVVSLEEMANMSAQAQAQQAAASQPAPAADPADPFAAALAEDGGDEDYNPDATVVAKVPDALLQATARAVGGGGAARDPDEEHFREVFREFVSTRQRCGEAADGLTFDKFAAKLKKNRDAIKEKHGARSVRFQVYVKAGKAALKATPVK